MKGWGSLRKSFVLVYLSFQFYNVLKYKHQETVSTVFKCPIHGG